MATSAVGLDNLRSSTTSGVLSSVGNLNNQIDRLTGIQESNNAFNAQEAADQREWSAEQAELSRQFNMAEASKNRKWQENMSNTAHQREIKDLQAAGLNPVLSALNGNGASVGSGATASSSNPEGTSAHADTSLSGAIVSLLNNSLNAMTQLASMSTSALTNQSVADKYTAAQKIAAMIGAGASMYGSNMSSAASRYSADQHLKGVIHSSDVSAAASKYVAGLTSAATRYAADRGFEAQKYANDMKAYLTKNFPQTFWGNVNSLLNGAVSGSGKTAYELLGEGIMDLFFPSEKKKQTPKGKLNLGYGDSSLGYY